MRPYRVFLEQVEEELRTTAVRLPHERTSNASREWHSPECRKCDLVSLADEAADRANALTEAA